MAFQNQISITSLTGTGSTSLFKVLQEKLKGEPYRWFSGGELFRARGAELGMSVGQFAAHCLEHPEEEHDRWVDETIQNHAQADWMICESRRAHFSMPHAFKVLLECHIVMRAMRRHRDQKHLSLLQVRREIEERDRNDIRRYASLYPGCLWESKRFDLIIDTAEGEPPQLAEILLSQHERWIARMSQLQPAHAAAP